MNTSKTPFLNASFPVSFELHETMKHSEKVIHIALSHPFQPTLPFFLLRSLGLEQLIKAKRKYQTAISVLFARIDEMSQMN